MSAINQVMPTQTNPVEDEEDEKQQQKKWSVSVMGRDIPYWLIVVVVVLVVAGVWWYMKNRKGKTDQYGLPTETRRSLDMASRTPAPSMGATDSSATSPSSAAVRQELRNLFEQF
jgi:cytoskeletal protein RodZ